jgi:RNA polymerase sigma-70 factor (ECF subfamily)
VTPPGEPTDEALASRAAAGEDRAFAQLVRRHQADLLRLLRRYLGSHDEAQEAAHEAFVAAWAALGRYDPARPFGAWLRTIAINKARDRGRRLRLRRLLFGERPVEEASAHLADPAADGAVALIARERLAQLDRAIAQLPSQLKEPLLLTALEGLTQQEAGEILGISAKAVETRVYRARRTLASRLAVSDAGSDRKSRE